MQYDPDKLIDYPGFNVPLSPDAIDVSLFTITELMSRSISFNKSVNFV